jgi:hypothetical protein
MIKKKLFIGRRSNTELVLLDSNLKVIPYQVDLKIISEPSQIPELKVSFDLLDFQIIDIDE